MKTVIKMQNFISKAKTLNYKTKERLHFITITKDIEQAVSDSGVEQGIVVIQSHHTTCSIWVNEDEKNLIGPKSSLGYTPDLMKILDRFASPKEDYHHNDINDKDNPNGKRDDHLCEPDSCGVIPECKNGHSHAQAMILPCSITMIIEKGKLVKGIWQEILLIELDHDRDRQISVLVQGLSK